MSIEFVEKYIRASVSAKEAVLRDKELLQKIWAAAELILTAYRDGGKILIAGNGGSAADAQHFAAELVGRFLFDRPALPALALTTDSSILTAIGNDYGYDRVFSRQVEANALKGDIFVAISTSGNSPNIVLAAESAKAKGVKNIGLTGPKPCKLDSLCDIMIKIPSEETPHIQESHITIIHLICKIVENGLFAK